VRIAVRPPRLAGVLDMNIVAQVAVHAYHASRFLNFPPFYARALIPVAGRESGRAVPAHRRATLRVRVQKRAKCFAIAYSGSIVPGLMLLVQCVHVTLGDQVHVWGPALCVRARARQVSPLSLSNLLQTLFLHTTR